MKASPNLFPEAKFKTLAQALSNETRSMQTFLGQGKPSVSYHFSHPPTPFIAPLTLCMAACHPLSPLQQRRGGVAEIQASKASSNLLAV